MKKRVVSIFLAIFVVSFSVFPAFAESKGASLYGRLVDNVNLLSDDEYIQLNATIDAISNKNDFDIVVVTEESIGSKTPTEYADDYFDYNGYGTGDNHDGILLLVDMIDEKWAISTCGSGIPYFTDYGQEKIMDKVQPLLSEGDYYDAFDTFTVMCNNYINQAKTNKPYDTDNVPNISISMLKPMTAVYTAIDLVFNAI